MTTAYGYPLVRALLKAAEPDAIKSKELAAALHETGFTLDGQTESGPYKHDLVTRLIHLVERDARKSILVLDALRAVKVELEENAPFERLV